MAKIEVTPHAKERTIERIGEMSVRDFLKGVQVGSLLLPGGEGPWAICVKKDGVVLGYAVGEKTKWSTTIDGGKTPDRRSKVVVVKV